MKDRPLPRMCDGLLRFAAFVLNALKGVHFSLKRKFKSLFLLYLKTLLLSYFHFINLFHVQMFIVV